MSLENRQSQSALDVLGNPGAAALRFGELLSQKDWAILGIGLNDLEPLVEHYGEMWKDQVLELVAECLLSGQRACGEPDDLLARLTGKTFLVITRVSSAALWVEELRRTFKEGISFTLSPAHLHDGMIRPSPTERLPMPCLAIGIVTDRNGPFPTTRDLLRKVTKAREQNERRALLFDLNSLMVTVCRLREDLQVAKHAPRLLTLLERYAQVATGPIHDLRNGLSVLREDAQRVARGLSDAAQAVELLTERIEENEQRISQVLSDAKHNDEQRRYAIKLIERYVQVNTEPVPDLTDELNALDEDRKIPKRPSNAAQTTEPHAEHIEENGQHMAQVPSNAERVVESLPKQTGEQERHIARAFSNTEQTIKSLVEQTKDLKQQKLKLLSDAKHGEALVAATCYSIFLLETCSEVRSRGVGNPGKVNLLELWAEDRPLWIQELDEDVQVTIDTPSEPVEIYGDQAQIAQALFLLADWLVSGEKGCSEISVTCRKNANRGEIIVTGDFDVTLNEASLIRQALVELQNEQKPSLFVFQKLVVRYGGSAQFQRGRIALSFPQYRWQDVRSTDTLKEQIRDLRIEVEDIKTHLNEIMPSKDEWIDDFSLKEVIGLGSRIVANLADEFSLIRREAERQRCEAPKNQTSLWESLEAGSHFCQLLAANLLSLERKYAFSPYATDVESVLESVWRMLRSKIHGIAELRWDVEDNLPPVRATETALAQAVTNLALNSLEELARARPPVAYLGFTARQIQDVVKIDISDTGGGLPTEVLEQLFKAPISTRQHVEGGIGLQVVKAILSELGGEIEFRSVVDEGTTASITLPIWRGEQ